MLSLLLSGCVEETLVLGDGRARQACIEAPVIAAPEVGCTTLRIESVSPYGCLETDVFSGAGRDHAGSWVRLSRAPDRPATVHVTLLGSSALCTLDGGAGPCPAVATLRAYGGVPCTCEPGNAQVWPLPLASAIPLDAAEEEVLLEPLGGSFEVSVCAASFGP